MSPSYELLREAALALPLKERLELADTLSSSLREAIQKSDLSSGFVAELERRSAEMDADPSSCVDWEEVRSEMEKPVAA